MTRLNHESNNARAQRIQLRAESTLASSRANWDRITNKEQDRYLAIAHRWADVNTYCADIVNRDVTNVSKAQAATLMRIDAEQRALRPTAVKDDAPKRKRKAQRHRRTAQRSPRP
jgi:hypothetical protein